MLKIKFHLSVRVFFFIIKYTSTTSLLCRPLCLSYKRLQVKKRIYVGSSLHTCTCSHLGNTCASSASSTDFSHLITLLEGLLVAACRHDSKVSLIANYVGSNRAPSQQYTNMVGKIATLYFQHALALK